MITNIKSLFKIQYPIIQGGMVWVSGGKLAGHVSKFGGLGLIGAGSMSPDILREHIKKAKAITSNPIGVNLPLLYGKIEQQIDICLEEGIKIFFTSAGSPKKWTPKLKSNGAIVVHVVSSPYLAKKCEDAGVDAVVAEGFEAGGHNGREELTTMALIPQVTAAVSIPVIAAGGIGSGNGIHAAMALGAAGVQMGTRFMMTKESSAHDSYKNELVSANFDSTQVRLKSHVPVRLLKNKFYDDVVDLEKKNPTKEQLIELLGKGRARKGMLEGDLVEGELEAGEICGLLNTIPTVEKLMKDLVSEYCLSVENTPRSL